MKKTRLSKIFEQLDERGKQPHISEYNDIIEEELLELPVSTGMISLEEAKDLTKLNPNNKSFKLSSLPENEAARTLVLNKVTDEDGYRYKAPMLTPTSKTYLKDYANFVVMKFVNEDNFKKMLNWD